MSSRESSLGAWADKLPAVDGWSGQAAWEETGLTQAVRSPAEMGPELKGLAALLLVGVGLLLGAGVFLLFSLNAVMGGEATEGVVIDLAERPSPKGTLYAPVVAYDADGGEYVFKSRTSTSWIRYEMGDTVPVVYFPDDPQRATIADFTQLWLLPTILGSAGLVFVSAALVLTAHVARKAGWRLLPA